MLPDSLPSALDLALITARLREQRDYFDRSLPIVIARAPGRLDVMGGIADYSGSLVLQYPIREAIFAALQKDSAPVVRIVSLLQETENFRSFEIPLERLTVGDLSDYKAAREYFIRSLVLDRAAERDPGGPHFAIVLADPDDIGSARRDGDGADVVAACGANRSPGCGGLDVVAAPQATAAGEHAALIVRIQDERRDEIRV